MTVRALVELWQPGGGDVTVIGELLSNGRLVYVRHTWVVTTEQFRYLLVRPAHSEIRDVIQ